MLPEGKCRYIDGQIYPDGNFYVLDTQHIKHNGSELKSALNGISTDISNKVDKETGKGLSTNDYTDADKNKLSGIEDNANNYVHPTTSGNKHIPSGGSSGKILGWSADGTAAWVDPASSGGSVDTVYIGSTEYAPDANGKVTLPTYPTTLPASDVYSWAKASTKPSYTASEVGAIATTSKGANNGVAELDSSGKVPSSQLPSYVDDVLEYSAKSSFPATGETGKIYVDTSTNLTYRWSGSAYTEISPSLALGETSSTAYRGDRGKAAYNHATDSSRLTTATASGLYKVASTAQGHIASLTAVVKSDITGLGIPAQDTTYSAATQSAAGLMSSTDKTKLDGIASGAQVNSITGVKGNSETNYRTGDVNLTAANIGAAASVHSHSVIEPKSQYSFDSSTKPNSFDLGVTTGFVNSNSGFGSYGTVLTSRSYSGGGGTLQLYAPYSPTYGGTHLKARFGNYETDSGNSWTELKDIAWTSDDTNTYVSAASFADNSSSSSANPLKMTLSRSGTITTPVTATLPKISSSTAGVVPKGSSVSSQSQSTKFLREDGTWAAPSYSSSSAFSISRYSSSYTVDAETWKSNGMAWFTILIKNSNQINANTSTIPAYVPSDLKPKGSRDINLVCDVDNKYCRAWITGGSQYIYIRSLENIPANSNIRITGCYPY